jgi:mRNA-degrading endonuclease RelE of RelBE toxin-antitoxin system
MWGNFCKDLQTLLYHIQDNIVSKLDEVVTSEWRDPAEYLEPLTGGPFEKLRVGQYRLACVLDREARVLEVHRIEHRRGAYTADD